jgi:hypothetical protein
VFEDARLGAGIDRRQRVVEQQQRASASSERAIATRWRWPPDSVMPRFADRRVVALREAQDVVVDGGHVGRVLDLGARGAGRARAMFSAIEAENRKDSCGTQLMAARSAASV